TGNVGDAEFEWPYANYPADATVTTQELQERYFLEAWKNMELLLPAQHRRLYAALLYFQTACRLSVAGLNPWEFMGEVLLNLSKVMEVLFPADGSSTINAAREGLEDLGCASLDIEKWYIPAIALRNGLDVAHVSLAAFNHEQLRAVHEYTEKAE